MNSRRTILVTVFIVLSVVVPAAAQKRKRTGRTTAPAAAVATQPAKTDGPATPEPDPISAKKNERPAAANLKSEETKPAPQADTSYYYEFTQPNFTIAKIVIRHDDAGKGTITFSKKSSEEQITDPLKVSADALARINAAYTALNFLDSSENYQFEKDYSHLGNSTFRLRKGGKERTITINYTQNKDAKSLMDEYRKLGNQYVWIFDITVARESQPLDAPRLMESLDALIKRGEISDTKQMVPFLTGLLNDERIPLMARNRAAKLVSQIEKQKN